jgi:hypothetical protein
MKATKAKREKLHSAIAIIGASGSGKTLSALFVAYGMMKEKYPDESEDFIWSKIGLADTEHKRALIYAEMEREGVNIGEFIHVDFDAPYSPARYKQAVKVLKEQGAEVIIIDSLSHAWEGEGGLLDMQQKAGGTFQAWNKIKPDIQDFIRTLTQSNIHVIGTMRTKIDYVMEQSELGKTNIKKVGLKPIMKDDLEYEFQIVFQVDEEHNAKATKDNSGLFETRPSKLNAEDGAKIFNWLEKGLDVQAEEREAKQRIAASVRELQKEANSDELNAYIEELEGKANRSIENMPMDFLEKAKMLIEKKHKDLGGS